MTPQPGRASQLHASASLGPPATAAACASCKMRSFSSLFADGGQGWGYMGPTCPFRPRSSMAYAEAKLHEDALVLTDVCCMHVCMHVCCSILPQAMLRAGQQWVCQKLSWLLEQVAVGGALIVKLQAVQQDVLFVFSGCYRAAKSATPLRSGFCHVVAHLNFQLAAAAAEPQKVSQCGPWNASCKGACVRCGEVNICLCVAIVLSGIPANCCSWLRGGRCLSCHGVARQRSQQGHS